MEEVNNLPEEFFAPIKNCLELLNNSNLTFFDKEKKFSKYIRYAYIVPCVIIFYISQSAYLRKVFKGELELFELGYVLPIYVVCTQSKYFCS